MIAYVNGRWLPDKKAYVSILERGFLYGDGLFETMRAYNGNIFMLAAHLRRLRDGLRVVRIQPRWSLTEIETLLYRALKKNKIQDGLLRLSITRGVGPIGLFPTRGDRATLVILTRRPTGASLSRHRQTYRAITHPAPWLESESGLAAVKSANRLPYILAFADARSRGMDEALLVNRNGHVTEGTITNLFIARNSGLVTPPADGGLLPGITRQAVIGLAKRCRIPIAEARLVRRDIFQADEAFLTNTSLEIMPLVRIDDRPVGSGQPGTMTEFLRQRFSIWVGSNKRVAR